MATRTLHPDYEAAAAERRWSRPLAELWIQLKRDAHADRGRLARAWRILPSGAVVSLVIDPETFRKKVRISRSSAPATDDGRRRWETELNTFEKHFPLILAHRWYREADPEAKGIAAFMSELYVGEISPGKAKCYVCGEPCKWEAGHAPDGCAHQHCTPVFTRQVPHPAARQLP